MEGWLAKRQPVVPQAAQPATGSDYKIASNEKQTPIPNRMNAR